MDDPPVRIKKRQRYIMQMEPKLKLGQDITIDQAKNWPLDTRAEGFHNLLHVAAWNHNEDAALVILERINQEGSREILFEQQMDGASPLFIAVQSNLVRMVEKIMLMISDEELERLLEVGMEDGMNVVRRAILNMHHEIIQADDVKKSEEIVRLIFEKAGDDLINKYEPTKIFQELLDKEQSSKEKIPEEQSKKRKRSNDNQFGGGTIENDELFFLMMLALLII